VDYMFDSNIFDQVVSGQIPITFINTRTKNGDKFYVTHIQKDELAQCPNIKRKNKLKRIFNAIPQDMKPTESFVVGKSRIGMAKLSNGKTLNKIRGNNMKKTNDALIGETALNNGYTLVTEDKKLRNKINKMGGNAIKAEEFFV